MILLVIMYGTTFGQINFVESSICFSRKLLRKDPSTLLRAGYVSKAERERACYWFMRFILSGLGLFLGLLLCIERIRRL